MTQKKFFQIAGIIVACVWVFCATFAIAITLQRKQDNKNIPVTNPPATTTTLPVQSTQNVFAASPATTLSSQTPQLSIPDSTLSTIPSQTTTVPSTTAPPQSSTPQGKDAIISAYLNGVNTLKNTPNFSMNKNDTLNVQIDEITGGSAVEAFANTMIAAPAPESYVFTGGVDSATGKTPNSVIAPLNLSAAVDPNAVTQALSQPNADGGYTVSLTIQPEVQTQDAQAPNLYTMVQVIDVQSLVPSGATIKELTINYAPSSIVAVFDSQNRIVSMQHHLVVTQGGGKGSMLMIPITMSMHGEYISDYSITY